jgi:thermitase
MKSVPKIKRVLHLLLVVLFLLLPCLSFAEEPKPPITDPTQGGLGFKAGEIIVKFKKGIPQATIQSLLLTQGMNMLDEMGQLGIMLLSVPEGQELEKIEELKRNPLVEYAEPNYAVQIAGPIVAEPYYSPLPTAVFPNDPYLQWNLTQIEAFTAWDITTGSERVVIAVVDSGVDLDHPELKDKIWTNPGETGIDANGNDKATNGIDDDRNGYVDDVHGWDFVNLDGNPEDEVWHGTYVASIAAAETNNGILIAGVSWGAEIMPVKVVNQEGRADIYHLNGGILYAADNGAKVINLGVQINGPDYPHSTQNVINYAYSKGALIVAGSGDPLPEDPRPLDEYRYPAALDHVISVAATDREDRHPDFSCYNDRVDVAAPGRGIWGVCILPAYAPAAPINGTYAAAAHVSGLAALIWSVNPNLTPDQVEEIIKSTAVDLGEPGRDNYFGWGRIDAAAAVMATTHYLEVEPAHVVDLGRVCDHGALPSWTIINPNTNASTWRAMTTDPWLSISGPEGLTPSWAMVSVDSSQLQGYGPYTAGITAISVMTNYEHSPIVIPVTAMYKHCWESYLPLVFHKD